MRERARPVRLLVVDSVAFHFRHDGAKGEARDYSKRLQSLGQMSQTLTELAAQQQLAAVVVNQVGARARRLASHQGFF